VTQTTVLPPAPTQSAALAQHLRHMIRDGRFAPEEPLPAQRAMAKRFNVGVQVVRSAMAVLEEEGLVDTHKRRGAFVRRPTQAGAGDVAGTGLRCVTFVERSTGTSPGFVRTGYLQGYADALDPYDIKMRFSTLPPTGEQWSSLISRHHEPGAQAVVLINVLSAPFMNWLRDQRIPYVVQYNKAYSADGYPPHHGVYINKVRAGFEAAQHLIELKHRRIGFIGSVPRGNTWTGDMYSGCQAGLGYAGLMFRPEDVLELDTNESAAARGPIEGYLDRSSRPTAVLTQNDTIALTLVDCARARGLRVPEDLSVIGFDDVPEAELSQPPLTSVANPRVMLGQTVVNNLIALADDPDLTPQHHVLEGQLVIRDSTGPAPTAR